MISLSFVVISLIIVFLNIFFFDIVFFDVLCEIIFCDLECIYISFDFIISLFEIFNLKIEYNESENYCGIIMINVGI